MIRTIATTAVLILGIGLGGCVAAGHGAADGTRRALISESDPPAAPYSPASDPWNWLAYTLAGTVAYAIGSVGKAKIRDRMGKHGDGA